MILLFSNSMLKNNQLRTKREYPKIIGPLMEFLLFKIPVLPSVPQEPPTKENILDKWTQVVP
jgi:hypothetical protein